MVKNKRPRAITEKKLDAAFSLYVRRIGKCEMCGSTQYLQCSHFYSRTARSVRFDEMNADCLCASCHRKMETKKNAEYYDWKLRKLGEDRFRKLRERYATCKRGGFTEKEKQALLDSWK